MAASILRELKGVNFSCSSPASTSITMDTDQQQQHSMLMTAGSSGRAIDRFSPHLRDPLRSKPLNNNNYPKIITRNKASEKAKAKAKVPAANLISPANSSRYLLSGTGEIIGSSEDQLDSGRIVIASVVPNEPARFQYVKAEDPIVVKPCSSSSASSCSKPREQVVVLRVSLHCKGCEGKVRKHISKMEGVTSFSTDLATKRVTVVGDVTPLGVLNSISKVKNAQLWPSPPPMML